MWNIGIAEKEPQTIYYALKQSLQLQHTYHLYGPNGDAGALPALDVLLVAGAVPPDVSCRVAVVPGQQAATMPFDAKRVITYGLSVKDTLTVSSAVDNDMALAVQREIVDVSGRRIDRQEIVFTRPRHMGIQQALACVGGMLALGVPPEELPGLLAPRGPSQKGILSPRQQS